MNNYVKFVLRSIRRRLRLLVKNARQLDHEELYKSLDGFMNLGYINESDISDPERVGMDVQDRCAALARKLAERASLEKSDILVDVGCGNGMQDFLFAREFGVQHITAFDIAKKQMAVAQSHLAQMPKAIQEAVTFKVGDAVCLPHPDQSATKVFSLESAFHYDSREDFFAEAYRILLPGGRLAITDHLPKQGVTFSPPRLLDWCRSYDIMILPVNRYDIEEYKRKLESIGFKDVVVEDISDRVFLWPNDRKKRVERKLSSFVTWAYPAYKLMNYYIVIASK